MRRTPPGFLASVVVLLLLSLPARAEDPAPPAGTEVAGAEVAGAEVAGAEAAGAEPSPTAAAPTAAAPTAAAPLQFEAAVAPGPPTTGDEATEQLDALAEQGDWATLALRSPEWARSFPDHFGPHYYAGLLYLMTNRFDEAVHELRTSVQLLPEFADGHAQLGTALALAGDDVAARPSFEQALALEPGNEAAAAELQDLHTRARLDGAAPPGMPPHGSPQRIAWDILSAVQADTLYEAWSEHVDPALTDPLFGDESPAGRVRAEREFVRGVVEGYRQELSSRVLGWELAEAVSIRPEQETSVTGTVLLEQTVSADRLKKQYEAIYSPLGAQIYDPAILEIYKALPPEEVALSFQRMADRPTRSLAEVRLDLVRRGDAWKVADATLTVRDVSEANLSAILSNKTLFPTTSSPVDPLTELSFQLGRYFGMTMMLACVLGVLGGGVGIGWVLLRGARRA